jgi:hypothetical protein
MAVFAYFATLLTWKTGTDHRSLHTVADTIINSVTGFAGDDYEQAIRNFVRDLPGRRPDPESARGIQRHQGIHRCCSVCDHHGPLGGFTNRKLTSFADGPDTVTCEVTRQPAPGNQGRLFFFACRDVQRQELKRQSNAGVVREVDRGAPGAVESRKLPGDKSALFA